MALITASTPPSRCTFSTQEDNCLKHGASFKLDIKKLEVFHGLNNSQRCIQLPYCTSLSRLPESSIKFKPASWLRAWFVKFAGPPRRSFNILTRFAVAVGSFFWRLSWYRKALPIVPFRAVCLVRAILLLLVIKELFQNETIRRNKEASARTMIKCAQA